MKKGTLYLCPTPLGNLQDITLRVLNVLRETHLIAAEDTRHTRKLLSHYEIHTPLTSYHEHNKMTKTAQLVQQLQVGRDIALVSDAGTPGIADPGEELVRAALAEGLKVVALPGPVAAVLALTASGLPAAPFVFYGFLAKRGAQRTVQLQQVMAETKTVILYEAPHQLRRTLAALCHYDAQRQAVLGRELTKLHEEYLRDTLEGLCRYFSSVTPRGEFTLLLAGAPQPAVSPEEAVRLAESYLAAGQPLREAVRQAAAETGGSRNEIYRRIIAKKKSE